jgi:hypothetical protein
LRSIHLHHLHGCLTHFRDTATNSVYKIAAADLRDQSIFDGLAQAEETPYVPSVILGSKKMEKSREWPFSVAFRSLEERATDAATIVIAGYSFRDAAVNLRLRNLLVPEKRWIVLDHQPDDVAAGSFTADVRAVIGDAEIELVFDGVGGSLPEASA